MNLKIKKTIKENEDIGNDEIIRFLLEDRGIIDKNNFINPIHPDKINFFEIFSEENFKKLIDKLICIRKNKEKILVYTDYDADGITGGAIMWETLHKLGFETMPYVPNRKTEGYGFSKIGLDKIKIEFNPKLIISVDHGIAAADKISYAKENGMEVVVTDHHLIGEKEIKDAVAIFHSDKLSGSGVSYFVAREIFYFFKKEKLINEETIFELNNLFKNDYLAIASIGTIADLVPLISYSRSLVKHGLMAFSKINRLGLSKLMKHAQIWGKTITTFDIGFIIAPRINALGRLEHAIDALRLLCTTQEEKAETLAEKINSKNSERKDIVKIAVQEALEIVKKNNKLDKIIILESNNWNEGIIGLIASKICEEYFRPTIIMTVSDGFAKGSVRSIPGFNITEFLKTQKKYLIDFGGHKMAAGFSIKKENISSFKKSAIKAANKIIKDEDIVKSIEIDVAIPIEKLNYELAEKISSFYPFGIGNSQPVFMTEGILKDARLIGKTNTHLKIKVEDKNGKSIDGVFFGASNMLSKISINENIKIIFNLEKNDWNYKKQIQALGKIIVL